MFPPRDNDYLGLRITVMGLGHFGGGIGAVRFLAAQGARVTLTDLKSAAELSESLDQIAGLSLEALRFGEHREEDFTSADLIVASPAIRPDHPCLEAARSCNVPVTTEIGLFWRHCPAKVIGVTGTAGKSTTSALIAHLLQSAGQCVFLGGNIGGSLLDKLPEIGPADWVLLELSSFQLMYLNAERRSPRVAVVTNFHPNHLDWHQSLEEYRHAKQTLLRYQTPQDVAVLPTDTEFVNWPTNGQRVEFGCDVDGPDSVGVTRSGLQLHLGDAIEAVHWEHTRFRLSGFHNRLNEAAAVAAAVAAGVAPQACAEGLRTFRGLPHRLEAVGEVGGVQFYNDSKATTPEAAIAALRAFDRPLIVLAGGSHKGADLSSFAAELAGRAKGIALMGETAPALVQMINATAAEHDAKADDSAAHSRSGAPPEVHLASDFRDAFSWAVSQAHAGDIILLSPGCASFGWFRDFEDRGCQFRFAVETLRS